MARPRVYARVSFVNGVYVLDKSGPITLNGLSVHKPTGEFYRIVDGARQYLGKNVDGITRRYLSRLKPDAAEVAPLQPAGFQGTCPS